MKMIKIKNNEITISKGDDAVIGITLKGYTLHGGDKLVFTVGTPTPIVKEVETLSIVLDAADTANVKAGTYEYDIKLVFATGEQQALIYPTQFVIKEVVE